MGLQPRLAVALARLPSRSGRRLGARDYRRRRLLNRLRGRGPVQLLELDADQPPRLTRGDRRSVVGQAQPAERVQPPQLSTACQSEVAGILRSSGHVIEVTVRLDLSR